MQWLSDPMWQGIGVAVGVISILVSVFIAIASRRSKRLSLRMRRVDVLSVGTEIRDRVQILFGGTPVDNVVLFELRLRSGGNVPIEPRDFIEPLKLSFGSSARVLSVDTVATSPQNLKPELDIELNGDGSSVVLTPLLLNQGDWIKLNCLTTGGDNVVADARISGVKAIDMERPRDREDEIMSGLFGSIATAALSLMLPGYLIFAVVSLLGLVQNIRRERQKKRRPAA